MNPRKLTPLLLLAFAAGCASGAPPQRTPGPGSTITSTSTGVMINLEPDDDGVAGLIERDAESVAAVLPVAYEALGIEAGALDRTGLSWGNPSFRGTRIGGERVSRYLRCGSDGTAVASAGSYRTRLSISSRVEPQPDGRSLLTTAVSGTGTSVEGTSTAPSRCVSTGELEELIAVTVTGLLERS